MVEGLHLGLMDRLTCLFCFTIGEICNNWVQGMEKAGFDSHVPQSNLNLTQQLLVTLLASMPQALATSGNMVLCKEGDGMMGLHAMDAEWAIGDAVRDMFWGWGTVVFKFKDYVSGSWHYVVDMEPHIPPEPDFEVGGCLA